MVYAWTALFNTERQHAVTGIPGSHRVALGHLARLPGRPNHQIVCASDSCCGIVGGQEQLHLPLAQMIEARRILPSFIVDDDEGSELGAEDDEDYDSDDQDDDDDDDEENDGTDDEDEEEDDNNDEEEEEEDEFGDDGNASGGDSDDELLSSQMEAALQVSTAAPQVPAAAPQAPAAPSAALRRSARSNKSHHQNLI